MLSSAYAGDSPVDGDTILGDDLSMFENDEAPRALTTSSEAEARRMSRRRYKCFMGSAMGGTLLFSLILAILRHFRDPVYRSIAGLPSAQEEKEARLQQALGYLLANDVNGEGAAWADQPDSPEYLAARWIATADQRRLELPPAASDPTKTPSAVERAFLQRYVLAVLFFATGGMDWQFKTNFLSGWHECSWWDPFTVRGSSGRILILGAICDNVQDETSITHLHLPPSNNMTGTLPPQLYHLTSLKEIIITNNPGIVGPIPSSYGLLQTLTTINFAFNNLEGPVPYELMFLTKLEKLNLEFNSLSGNLLFTERMFALKELSIEYNPNITGNIPATISKLTKLEVLSLSNTGIHGTLPFGMSSLKNLKYLLLDDNQLEGSLDPIKDLDQLTHLYLEDNNFNDTMNDSFLVNLKNLVHLDLSSNLFDGSIPYHFFNMTALRVLDISSNRLTEKLPVEAMASSDADKGLLFLSMHSNNITGPIPKEIAHYSDLLHLDMSSNDFTGELLIPELGELLNLQYLFLGRNEKLNSDGGEIPEFFRNMTNLAELSLKGLGLTGNIPEWMGELDRLRFLDLGENELEGNLPESLGNLTKLWVLIVNKNELNGTIPLSFNDMKRLETFILDDNNFTGDTDGLCSREDKLEFFISDCASSTTSDGATNDGNSTIEIRCDCCTTCCHDENVTCNDDEWLGNHQAIWENGYSRVQWEFDAGTVSRLAD